MCATQLAGICDMAYPQKKLDIIYSGGDGDEEEVEDEVGVVSAGGCVDGRGWREERKAREANRHTFHSE